MALTTSTITGRVPLPTDQPAVASVLVFSLSAADSEGGAVVLPASITVALGDDACLPEGFALWRNTEGLRGTHYRVTAEWVEPGRLATPIQRRAEIGRVLVGDAASYTIGDLLDVTPAPPPDLWWRAITQAEYDAAIAARDESAAARDAAAASAGQAAGSAAAAGGSAQAAETSAQAAALAAAAVGVFAATGEGLAATTPGQVFYAPVPAGLGLWRHDAGPVAVLLAVLLPTESTVSHVSETATAVTLLIGAAP